MFARIFGQGKQEPVVAQPTRVNLLPPSVEPVYGVRVAMRGEEVSAVVSAVVPYKQHADGETVNCTVVVEVPVPPELIEQLKAILIANQMTLQRRVQIEVSEATLSAARRGEL